MTAKESANEIRRQTVDLYRAAPETMRAFQEVMKAASKAGVLPTKTKELIALAIAISVKCDGCIVFHLQNAIAHEVKREEVVETIAVAIEMGGGPATVYGGKALAAFDELVAGR